MNEKNETVDITTCQICGRPIKSRTGVIAHHGYKRPHRHSGWQTSSCFGARRMPYEVSCDALPPAISSLETHIAKVQTRINELMTTPPDTLTYYGRGYGGRPDPKKGAEVVSRPDGFEPNSKNRSYRIGHYDTLFFQLTYDTERDVDASVMTLEYLRKRLSDWKEIYAVADSMGAE